MPLKLKRKEVWKSFFLKAPPSSWLEQVKREELPCCFFSLKADLTIKNSEVWDSYRRQSHGIARVYRALGEDRFEEAVHAAGGLVITTAVYES